MTINSANAAVMHKVPEMKFLINITFSFVKRKVGITPVNSIN